MLLLSFFSGLATLVTFVSLLPTIKDFVKEAPLETSSDP
jgi:hypothetical protein